MAQIALTIPDAQLTRVIDAMAKRFGYQAVIADPSKPPDGTMANPETKAQFAKRMLSNILKDAVKSVEAETAATSAATTASNKVDTEITIT